MIIDVQTIITSLLGMTCLLLGWLGRQLWDAVQQLRRDLAALEVRMTRDYVHFDRLQDAMKPIMDALHQIRHTLEGKADKLGR